jgi:CHAT domain-containing protein
VRRGIAFLSTGLAAALLVAGCNGGVTGGKPDSNAAGGDLGQNLVGEACRSVQSDLVDPDAPPPLNIICGAGKGLAGVVHTAYLPLSVPASGPSRREALERAAGQTPAALGIAARMSCRPGHWLPVQGVPTDDGAAKEGGEILVAPCVLNEGGWPQIVVTAALGKTLYQAEGLPSLMPVFVAAIGASSGRKLDVGEAGTSIAALETVLNSKLPSFGTGDLSEYNELMRAARVYNAGRNSAEAENAYRRALEIQTRVFGASSPGAGEALMALALEVSNQGRFEESANLFRRAEPIIERSPNAMDRARLSAYEALDAANQGHYRDALRYAHEASTLRRTKVEAAQPGLDGIGGAEPTVVSRGELAHSLSIEAAMALRLDDMATAQASAEEALQIISDTPGLPPWWRANALSLMGQINARRGRFAAAERNYLDALAFRQRLFGDTAPTALADLALGRLYADEELNPQAVRAYRAAFAILEKDRAARSEFSFDQLAPFLKAASALSERNVEERAGLEAEMLRAVQLAGAGVSDQTIARASARLAAADPAVADLVRQLQTAQRRQDSARIDLANETAKPDEERGSIREAGLVQEVVTASASAEQLQEALLKAFPAYSKLANPGPAELDELRTQLQPGEGLISFTFGREQAYAILITSDRFVVRKLDLTEAALAAAVGELRRAFVPRLGTVPEFDLRDSYALYRRLLGPFDAALAGINHLIVVPGGALASLPLGILVTSNPASGGERDYAHAAWLIRRVALSQVPSMRAFISLRAAGPGRARPAHPFLGFGNPTFAGTAQPADGKPSALVALALQCRDNGPMPAEMLRALAPLPETAGEVNTVARLLGADGNSVFLGRDATESKLRGLPLDQYGVLYFATHGLLPGELRCQAEPGLALSPPESPATSKEADGLLDATEIAGLSLNADLVVLSACNTASGGGRFGGEALSGLAEAFFYAGARALLASHWEVPSTATVRLMTGLFERAGPGLARGTAESLRQSQLALLDQPATAHPFFWAAFTVIGGGGHSTAARGVAAAQ